MKSYTTCFILFLSITLISEVNFIEIPIGINFAEPWSVQAVNMDGDDDTDILSSSRLDNKIAWWEKTENGYDYHQISNQSYSAMGLVAFDIDNDEDIDVVCTSQVNGVELWVNNGNQVFNRQIVEYWPCPTYVDSADVNLDGLTDILVCCCENNSNRMGWIENLGNLEFASHEVMTNWHQANSIDAGDIDSDGDIDLIGTASGREVGHGEIIIFYNDGDEFFTPDTLYATSDRPSFAIIRDLDQDGDLDVLATICYLNQAIWFENIDNEFQDAQTIGYGLNRGLTLDVADFDNDDDMDVISSSINLNRLYWFENIDMEFTTHIVSYNYSGAADVYPFDMDEDGDMDFLSTAQYDNKVSLWENQLLTSCEEYQIAGSNQDFQLQNCPNPFNPSTTISFELNTETSENTELMIYNLKGQQIKNLSPSLCHPELIEGRGNKYSITWNGTDNSGKPVSSGIYFYKLKSGNFEHTKRMILMK